MNQVLSSIKNVVAVRPIVFDNYATYYEDARSAAFYAMGIALKSKETVVLLVPGEFISNTYTAITEAWFQKANIIVVAIYDKISNVKTAWMDRCIINTLTAGINETEIIENFIFSNKGSNGPVLLNIVNDELPEKPKINYSILMPYLKNVNIITFDAVKDGINTNIPYKYKYGVLSKYIGMSISKNCGVLLCNAECVLVDLNVFRTRYANKNMKIVILDNGVLISKDFKIWLESNGWLCKFTDSPEDINWLLHSDEQSVLIVEVK